MRIISFTKMWDKLKKPEFTTFRFPRKDKDWQEGETVQVYFKNRSPNREKLGDAIIVKKEVKVTGRPNTDITDEEAREDGFSDVRDMEQWLIQTYGIRKVCEESMNKLSLRWI